MSNQTWMYSMRFIQAAGLCCTNGSEVIIMNVAVVFDKLVRPVVSPGLQATSARPAHSAARAGFDDSIHRAMGRSLIPFPPILRGRSVRDELPREKE